MFTVQRKPFESSRWMKKFCPYCKITDCDQNCEKRNYCSISTNKACSMNKNDKLRCENIKYDVRYYQRYRN